MLLIVDKDGNVKPAAQLEINAPIDYKGNNVWEVGRIKTTEDLGTATSWATSWATFTASHFVTRRLTPATKVSPALTRHPPSGTIYFSQGEATHQKWATAKRAISATVSASVVNRPTRYLTGEDWLTAKGTFTQLVSDSTIESTVTQDKLCTESHTVTKEVSAAAACPDCDTECPGDPVLSMDAPSGSCDCANNLICAGEPGLGHTGGDVTLLYTTTECQWWSNPYNDGTADDAHARLICQDDWCPDCWHLDIRNSGTCSGASLGIIWQDTSPSFTCSGGGAPTGSGTLAGQNSSAWTACDTQGCTMDYTLT